MKYSYYLFLALFFFIACEDVERKPIDQDGVAPQQVTDVMIESIPGGATITYQLPPDPDLLYVEAAYVLPNGERMRVNSSYNGRSVVVEGFAEVIEYQVALTSVDRAGNRSEPYIVNFTPDTPPVISVFNSIEMQPDFGGVNLQWTNPAEAELAIMISKKDELGDDVNIDTYYTSAQTGTYTIRGQKIEEGDFSVQVRDKWNNLSDVKRKTLTPIYEEKLDRHNFSALGQDYADRVSDYGNIPKFWDNNFENNVFGGSDFPWYASFSLGDKPIRLSRLVIWQYAWANTLNYGHYYAGGNGKTFEIYGSNSPTPDMSGWTLLQTCDIVKPSGLPYAIGRDNMSDEDFDLAHNKGHEFNIPLNAPSVRYIRIRSIDTFGSNLANFSELEFYGDPR